jgi:hypothetical protein
VDNIDVWHVNPYALAGEPEGLGPSSTRRPAFGEADDGGPARLRPPRQGRMDPAAQAPVVGASLAPTGCSTRPLVAAAATDAPQQHAPEPGARRLPARPAGSSIAARRGRGTTPSAHALDPRACYAHARLTEAPVVQVPPRLHPPRNDAAGVTLDDSGRDALRGPAVGRAPAAPAPGSRLPDPAGSATARQSHSPHRIDLSSVIGADRCDPQARAATPELEYEAKGAMKGKPLGDALGKHGCENAEQLQSRSIYLIRPAGRLTAPTRAGSTLDAINLVALDCTETRGSV